MSNKKEQKIIYKFLRKVDFNEDDFTFQIIYRFLEAHGIDIDINKLEISEEINDLKDKLSEVFLNARLNNNSYCTFLHQETNHLKLIRN